MKEFKKLLDDLQKHLIIFGLSFAVFIIYFLISFFSNPNASINSRVDPVITRQSIQTFPTKKSTPVKIMFPLMFQASSPTILIGSPLETEEPLPELVITIEPAQENEPESENVEEGCAVGCTDHKAGCDIKGNISYKTGEKIYHVPGGEFFIDTVINPEYGERWFCTEAEAIANGWRKSKR
jgi:hypothetical protein